jgi:hypothetical protein
MDGVVGVHSQIEILDNFSLGMSHSRPSVPPTSPDFARGLIDAKQT